MTFLACRRWIERCTFYSSSVLWFHEYLQTLPMEIENIWRRKLSTPSILFLINRYIASISVVVSICGEIGGPAAIARYDTMGSCFIHSLANLSFSYNDLLHVQRVCGIITGHLRAVRITCSPTPYPLDTANTVLFTIRVYAINGKMRSILLFAGILIVARLGCYIWVGLFPVQL